MEKEYQNIYNTDANFLTLFSVLQSHNWEDIEKDTRNYSHLSVNITLISPVRDFTAYLSLLWATTGDIYFVKNIQKYAYS